MITIINGRTTGPDAEAFAYIREQRFLGRTLLTLTRHLRAVNAARYMVPKKRHLDVGCGDAYFLKRSPCKERYGLDKQIGEEVTDHVDFPDNFFDYVTMLAVIEFIPELEPLFREIWRVLVPAGYLILTTPKKSVGCIKLLYAKEVDDRLTSFNRDKISKLCGSRFGIVGHHSFLCGLNQVFCLQKRGF